MPYESGMDPIHDAHRKFDVRFHLVAVCFLLFDVETVFLLPFAVAFLKLSTGAFLVAMLFLLLLGEGLVWAWSKGLLNWRGIAKPNLTFFAD